MIQTQHPPPSPPCPSPPVSTLPCPPATGQLGPRVPGAVVALPVATLCLLPYFTFLYYTLLYLTIPDYGSAARWPRSFIASSEMVATAVDLSNLPPLVTPPGTLITVHQSAVLGHPLTRPSTSELAQVISYEAYAPPPQPLPAPTEKTAPSLGSSSSQAGAAAGGSTGYMAHYV